MQRAISASICLLVVACGGGHAQVDAAVDAGVDTGALPMDLDFSAVADPAEPVGCTEAPPASGQVRAKHVDCDRELATGWLAMGRVGDIVLENARVRFIVRTGSESASTIGAPPGGVIDAVRGSSPDALKEVFPLFDFASISVTDLQVVDAGASGEARVRLLFDDAPLEILATVAPGLVRTGRVRGQVDYVLAPDSDALTMEVSFTTRRGVVNARLRPGMFALLGGQELTEPGYGLFEDGRAGGAGAALVGERASDALAFGFDGEVSVAKVQTIHLITASSAINVSQGSLSLFSARIAPGLTAAEAYAAVVAPGMGELVVQGAAGDRIEVKDAAGQVWLRTRLDERGGARIPAPVGEYGVRSGFRGFFLGAEERVTHGMEDTPVLSPVAPSAGLSIAATADGDTDAPVRVVLMQAGEEFERYVAKGNTPRRLPPGAYSVHVSHGMEFDVFAFDVELAEGESVLLEPDLGRVVDTSGWVSADLHLHTELSTDSVHPVGAAVMQLAAEGLDAASSSDHDFITDYASIAAGVGVADRLLLVGGAEVSTTSFGHINGYPLRRDPERAGYGAPVWFEMSPTDIFSALRAQGDASLGGAIVQLNHPRLGSAGFFTAVGLDLETGHATASPLDLGLDSSVDLDDFGFDVVEIWNGYTRGTNEQAFGDYLALRAAGRRFTMVGNSDSHLVSLPAGLPRSFVRVPDDTPGAFGWGDIAASLRSGEVSVSGGIFVTAEPVGAPAGDTLSLHVRVQAAPWVEVDRLRVYAGRMVALEVPVPATSEVTRLDQVLDVPLGGASFVVARADGMGAPEPYQHFAPYGVTNALDVPR